jgi:hypothetical protein
VCALSPVCARRGGAKFLDRRLHGQRAAHGPLRVVLAGGFRSPQGHDRVADVLVDAAAVVGDGPVDGRPQIVHDPGHDLGVHRFRQGREAGDVGEEDGGLLALLGGLGLGFQCGQFFPQRSDARIDYRVAKNGSLGFKGGDAGFQWIDFIIVRGYG